MDSCISMSSHRTFSALIQFSMPCHSWQVLPHSWQVFSLTRIIFSQTGLQAKLNLGNPSFRLLFQVSQPLNSQTQHFSHIYQSYHPTMSYDTPYKGSSLFKRSDPDKDREAVHCVSTLKFIQLYVFYQVFFWEVQKVSFLRK